MSAVRDLTVALIAGGMDPADAAVLVVRAGAELATAAPSKAALRTRKWRAGQASQNVTGDDSVTHDEPVTERHRPSPNVTRDVASLSLNRTIDQENKKKREATRASQLLEGWRPDEHVWQATVALIGEQRCEIELKKFRNHAADKGRASKNWNAAWRNWVDRAIDYGAKNGHGTSNHPANSAANQSGSAAIVAGVAAAAERRGRERAAGGSGHGPPPRNADASREPDFEFGGASDG